MCLVSPELKEDCLMDQKMRMEYIIEISRLNKQVEKLKESLRNCADSVWEDD